MDAGRELSLPLVDDRERLHPREGGDEFGAGGLQRSVIVGIAGSDRVVGHRLQPVAGVGQPGEGAHPLVALVRALDHVIGGVAGLQQQHRQQAGEHQPRGGEGGEFSPY